MSDVLETLHSAYSFIRGVEANKAVGALTLDHLIQAQIDMLQAGSARPIQDSTGQGSDVRISKWDRLDALDTSMKQVISDIQDAGDNEDSLAALGLAIPESSVPAVNT